MEQLFAENDKRLLDTELEKANLRLADSTEPGWYYQTEHDGKNWVTDIED